jgi:hypothetical protein
MLRQVKKNKNIERPTHLLVFALALTFLVGCTYIHEAGMTEWDYKLTKEGYELHCAEMIDSDCVTYQWRNETTNTYRRFHGPSINGTNSSDN